MIDKIMAELPPEMQEQAKKTNKHFIAMRDLEALQSDLNERLEIARLEWKREDRLWRSMISNYKADA